jgi:WD40 repeat protein
LYDHGFMSAMAFSHDSRRLVVAEGHWGTITIWDTTNWSRTRRWPNRATGRNRKIELIQFSQDGLTLLIVSNHFVTTLDSDTGASLKIVSMGQTMGRNMDCRLITANGHLVVFVNYRLERLTITNILQDPVETTQLTESTLGVRLSAGQFTADGKFFSVSSRSSDQCALRVFDVSNPPYECVRTITCPIFLPTTAAFLPNDNTKWVALHDDRRLRLWNVASGEHTVVATLPTRGNGDPLHIADLVVSPNGRVVVMTSPGGHDGHDKDVLHFVRLPSS